MLSPDGRTVAYTTWTALSYDPASNSANLKNGSVFTAPVQGGQAHRLDQLNSPGAYVDPYFPIFSPDSASLVYAVHEDTPNVGGIYRAAVDGSSRLKITNANVTFPFTLALMPDGAHIVYQESFESDFQSVSVNGGSSVPLNTPLLKHPSYPLVMDTVNNPRIAPDSSRILYSRHRTFDDYYYGTVQTDLYSVRPDGSDLRLVAANAGFINSVSPDGKYALMERVVHPFNSPYQYSASAVPTDGGPEIMLHSPLAAWANAFPDWFTPDSKQAIIQSDFANDEFYDLYRVPLATGSPIRLNDPLMPGDGVTPEMFTPDGRHLLYRRTSTYGETGGLYRASLDGEPLIKLTIPLQPGGRIDLFAISPDGNRVAYLAYDPLLDVYRIFAASIDGSNTVQLGPELPVETDIYLFALNEAGDQLVYSAAPSRYGQHELFVVPTSGGTSTKLNPTLAAGDEVMDLLVTGNTAVFTVGKWYAKHSLYAVQIPEPPVAYSWMGTIFSLAVVIRRRQR